MSVYDEILEKKKQDRIRYELEQRKKEIEELDKEIGRRRSINYDLSSQIIDKDKEIERQSKMLINRDKELLKMNDENERLHSIIKEVREYIEENISYYYDEDLDEGVYQDEISGDKVLEILDKEKE